MRIEDIMTRDVVTLRPGQSLREAAEALEKEGISGAPVVRDGELVGVLSEGDVVGALRTTELGYEIWFPSPFEVIEVPIRNLVKWRQVKEELEEVGSYLVEDAMTRNVKDVSPDDTVERAAELMSRHGINRLPVVDDDGRLVGIVTREDIVRGLI